MGLLLYGTHNKIFEVLYVLKLRSIFLQVNGYHGETFGYIVQCSTLCPEGVESQKVKTSSCNAQSDKKNVHEILETTVSITYFMCNYGSVDLL